MLDIRLEKLIAGCVSVCDHDESPFCVQLNFFL